MGEKENSYAMATTTTNKITTAADNSATITNKITTAADDAAKNDMKKNRIQVSNTKRPLFFYLNLAKRYIKQHNDVELSALGMAIPTVVIIAEILKRNGLAIETRITTSTVGTKDEAKGRMVQKAKIEVVLTKPENGDANQKPKTAAANQKLETGSANQKTT